MTGAGDADVPWARVADLFDRALEQPAAARGAFVETEAAGSPRLADDVLALLAAHERAGSALDRPPPGLADATASSRDAATADASRLTPGQMLGAYRLLRVIGTGGMGIVYLADDTRLGRRVALKALHTDAAADPARVARLEREARTAAGINHPGIATIYALEAIDGQVVIASEYVEGPTLRQMLAEGPLTPARAAAILRALAAAVAAAHARGIVHRDLKPENIVCTADGGLKILDFGIARASRDGSGGTLTEEHAVIGTPGYMAPEQIRGEAVDGRADLFALGVIGYEMLTGRQPFDGGHPGATLARVLQLDPPAPSRVRADAVGPNDPPTSNADRALLDHLDRVVGSCLAKRPEARMPSADTLIEALGPTRATTGPSLDAALASGTAGRSHARWWWRFHQATAIVVHVLLLVPLWGARDLSSADRGMWLLLVGVLAVTVGGALRMHLLFTARERPTHLASAYRHSSGTVRAADLVYATTLLVAAVLALRAEAPAVLLAAAAASVGVATLVIDPATTRAAWRDADR